MPIVWHWLHVLIPMVPVPVWVPVNVCPAPSSITLDDARFNPTPVPVICMSAVRVHVPPSGPSVVSTQVPTWEQSPPFFVPDWPIEKCSPLTVPLGMLVSETPS